MKFKRSTVERIVREELNSVVKEMYETNFGVHEADDDKDKKKEPEVGGADKDNDNVEPQKAGPDIAPEVGDKETPAPDGEEPADTDIPDEDVPAGDDPSDTELSQDAEDPAEEEPEGGDISKEIAGRSVQSITLEPESKLMPGAKEIVVQFEEIPQPLRILIGRSGVIKYHFKGSIHNEL
jgi:hypothetical protein